MYLYLIMLAPLLLLKSFASATDMNFSITWSTSDVAGTPPCLDDMPDAVSDTVTVKANEFIAQEFAEVAHWTHGVRYGGDRQLRVRGLTCSAGTACTWTKCKFGTTCYDTNYCGCSGRREERQLYHVERTLDAVDIENLRNGLIGACQEALVEEANREGDLYSASCKLALIEKLCDAVVTEVA
jgi:hypothetical protein